MKPITLATVRRLGREAEARRVIVFFERELPDGQLGFGYASWGATKRLCQSTKRLADQLYDAVEDELGEAMIAEYDLAQSEQGRG